VGIFDFRPRRSCAEVYHAAADIMSAIAMRASTAQNAPADPRPANPGMCTAASATRNVRVFGCEPPETVLPGPSGIEVTVPAGPEIVLSNPGVSPPVPGFVPPPEPFPGLCGPPPSPLWGCLPAQGPVNFDAPTRASALRARASSAGGNGCMPGGSSD
jgi:hypothetical protein